MTALVYVTLLRGLLELDGANWLADALLHQVVPLLSLAAWAVAGPRPRVGGREAAYALCWPVAWLVWTLVVRQVDGWVPYPFLDPDEDGLGRGRHRLWRDHDSLPPAVRALRVARPEARHPPLASVGGMEFRYLGNSGLKISEITYGNWLTHGSQVENDVATQCVRAALDEGISTFDTADVYANTAAETVLGEALKGERRESLEIFTKVYWPTGPKGKNDTGLSRKHIMESINGSLERLQTDYVDLYQAHRYDVETPLEETMQAFADVVRQGKALYIGVSEWTADQIRAGVELSKELGFQLISSQPQYSMLWRVIEDEVVPASKELGVSQIVWSPIAQGVLTGKYKPGAEPPAGSRATDTKGGADMISRWMKRRRPHRRPGPRAHRSGLRPHHGPARRGLGPPERQRRRRPRRRLPPRAGRRQRQGRRREARRRRDEAHRRRHRLGRHPRPEADPGPRGSRGLRSSAIRPGTRPSAHAPRR